MLFHTLFSRALCVLLLPIAHDKVIFFYSQLYWILVRCMYFCIMWCASMWLPGELLSRAGKMVIVCLSSHVIHCYDVHFITERNRKKKVYICCVQCPFSSLCYTFCLSFFSCFCYCWWIFLLKCQLFYIFFV